ncbi:MAG: hypothetical protein Q7S40_16195 [Opitutaceae bacterium]|nr:hypothetical protein [Opitutaceae bacterium]
MAAQPDCNSPAFWRDGRLYWYGSHGSPWLSQGPDQFGPWETRSAFVPSPDNSPKWMEAVWPESNGVVWGWYHAEPVNLIPNSTLSAPKVGAAVSFDGGYTMNDLGFILTSGDPVDPTAQNGYFAGGHGDPSAILDRQQKYFYFFFGNYGGPAESQGVCVARMAFEDRSNPSGAVWKYYNGKWQEAGLGGRTTPIFPVSIPWGSSDPDAFWGPAVHWNTYLNCYVMLLNHTSGEPGWSQEGVYISFNADLSRPDWWTQPRKILDRSDFVDRGAYYAQVMGLEPGGTDRLAGQTARLYLHGTSKWEIDFIAPQIAPTAVSVTATATSGMVMAGQAVTLSAAAMGLPPFTYQWLKDGFAIPLANAATYEIARAGSTDAGVYSVIVMNNLGAATSDGFTLAVTVPIVVPPPQESFLSNLSVRSSLGGNGGSLMLGFALQSTAPKAVLLRAIGPTLAVFGVPDAAADPRLAVYDAGGTPIGDNDDWQSSDAANFAAAGAFALPEGSTDAGLVLTARSGTATAIVTAPTGGVVLAEIYDPAASASSKLVNASARAVVGPDSQVMVGGFMVSGTGNKRLLIRALGPQLAAFGVSAALANPVLEVYDQTATRIATNDGWDPALEPEFATVGALSLTPGSRDAAVVVTLAAGNSYTVVLRSGDGSTGEAVLEIYELR